MENEGQAVNRPPLFNGNDYDYWKKRMIAFFDAQNMDIWDLVQNGYQTPTNAEGQDLPRPQWTEGQRTRHQLNSKAKHYLMCAITRSEHDKVHSCETAKEIWDTLALAHEGSSQVKESKISMLVHQYELFKMGEHENIDQMFGRFQTIINGLRSLGKNYDNQDHIRKILRSLSRQWRPKVTAIQEAKNLASLTMEELLGSLKVHELELQEKESSRKGKSIALKAHKGSTSKALKTEKSSDEAESSEDDISDNDELSFISRKIQAMWKKKGGMRRKHFGRRSPKDRTETKDKSPIICYECKKPGHIKAECPSLNKEKEKRRFFPKKKRGLMATWEDLDLSTTDDEEEAEEEANLCLMANTVSEEEEDEVTNCDLDLQNAFDELLNNSSILAVEYKSLKRKFSKLTREYGKMFSEKQELEIYCEKLKTENALLKTSSESNTSDEVDKLHNEVKELTEDLSKFVKSTNNLNILLKYSRDPRDKSGLGYQDTDKQFLQKTTTQPNFIKNVCKKNVYSSSIDFFNKRSKYYGSPRANQKGPKKIWVPKDMIIPLADVLSNKKKTPVMVPGQWLLTAHDGRKVYVPRHQN